MITLDDITDLVLAQRTSAWADVARRIAHEIKNPLTPISSPPSASGANTARSSPRSRGFRSMHGPIVRQVDDIKRMVDEFSSFARMPKPAISDEDLAETIRQVVFMMKIAHPEIEFVDRVPAGRLVAPFDRRLVSQAVTNIVKNATEAIAAVREAEGAGADLGAARRYPSGVSDHCRHG
ncbi:hypothetical protein BB934_27425 [Microvirga ossetica]|uniref:histidine kinase n=1 Tax=Microvirga ossetica TaxID=1882682 RepID=A0A1B2ENH0_9HYPH|nr:hypothetical protein [Microvirga ossetica]ANY81501.1 hypothetical protein BB934_27425 [Microvirga ossetica]